MEAARQHGYVSIQREDQMPRALPTEGIEAEAQLEKRWSRSIGFHAVFGNRSRSPDYHSAQPGRRRVVCDEASARSHQEWPPAVDIDERRLDGVVAGERIRRDA